LLEDRAAPDFTTAGAASFRTNRSAPKKLEQQVLPNPAPLGWIALGRDAALEQSLLDELHRRLGRAPILSQPVLE